MPKFKIEVNEKTGTWIHLINSKGEHLHISSNTENLCVSKYDEDGCLIHNSAYGNLETFLNS